MAIYRDTGVFCLSITGTENLQYRPLLPKVQKYNEMIVIIKVFINRMHGYI